MKYRVKFCLTALLLIFCQGFTGKSLKSNNQAMMTPTDNCEREILPQPPCCGVGAVKKGPTTDRYVVAPNELPWLVYIELKLKNKFDNSNEDPTVHCGGSLINANWVLTAAHCFYYHTVVAVHLGERNCFKGKCGLHDIRIKVDKTIVHKGFLYWDFEEDIVLLRLARPVFFTKSVRPICLLPRGGNFSGKIGTVAGWGRTADKIFSSYLLKAYVQIGNVRHCKYLFEGLALKDAYHMCAGGEKNVSPCDGDSGGPLMLQLPFGDRKSGMRAYYQLGIISFGVCGLKGSPIVYTNVTNYVDWIAETIAMN